MRTKTKAFVLALCAVLLVVSTVFVTMAFLTDTDFVTNTFTVGKVGISLDEADVDVNGKVEAGGDRESTEGRVQENKYHLIPRHNYVKDPTIHVDGDSENCLLFVELKNGLMPIIAGEKTYSPEDPADTVYTIEAQMIKNGWTLINPDKNIWAYNNVVDKNAHIEVFDEFTLTDDAAVSQYGDASIVVTAYAVQADGFVTDTSVGAEVSSVVAENAWSSAFGN